jgi:hypothetical protein
MKHDDEHLERNVQRLLQASLQSRPDEGLKKRTYQSILLHLHSVRQLVEYPWQALAGFVILLFLLVAISVWKIGQPAFSDSPLWVIPLIVAGLNLLIIPAACILIVIRRRYAY